MIRLNKYISNSGVCSRREADVLISEGKIKINNQVVTALGTKVNKEDIVIYNGKILKAENHKYILINKPKNCITTVKDTHERKTVMDIIEGVCDERLYPVGRLDRDTTGLLLMTNDGELTTRLTHLSFGIKKKYVIQLENSNYIILANSLYNTMEYFDKTLLHLDRIEFAGIRKGNLQRGNWRFLDPKEVGYLKMTKSR